MGYLLEKIVHRRDSMSSGRNFSTSSSNRAREAASCMTAGSVIGTPINFHSAAESVARKRPFNINFAPSDYCDPSGGIRDMEQFVGLFQNAFDQLFFRNPFETTCWKNARSGYNSNLQKLIAMIFHRKLPSSAPTAYGWYAVRIIARASHQCKTLLDMLRSTEYNQANSSVGYESMALTLGEELARLRQVKGRNVSLREVERQTGISNEYLPQLEPGIPTKPPPDVLKKLATFYGVPYESLLISAGEFKEKTAGQ